MTTVTPFLSEINQQPEALASLLHHLRGDGGFHLEAAHDLCAGRDLHFVGMGSSMIAPLAVRPALVRFGIAAEIREAGELLHYTPDSIPSEAVVVAISQSGESAETLRVVKSLSPSHRVLAVTNTPDSGLGRRGDVVLALCAGAEAAISTKTYSNTLALLHVLGALLTSGDVEAEASRLEKIAGDMQVVLDERRDEMVAAAGFFRGAAFLYFIARGPSLAAAHQGALTLNEGARLPTCALAGGTFRHGPLELAGEDFSAVIAAPQGSTWDLSAGLAGELAEAGGRVLFLTDRPPPDPSENLRIVAVPRRGEDLFSLSACIPIELLLDQMARDRGREAGVFERITKVTATE